jgi:hypothetical protein
VRLFAPLAGTIESLAADALVDPVGLGQRFIESVLPNHLAQRRVRDLIDGPRT